MTVFSVTRAFVVKPGVNGYRHLNRVVPLSRPQTSLCSVARAQTDAQSSDATASSDHQSDDIIIQKPWKTLFDLKLPEGQCLGLRIDAPQNSDDALLSKEAIASPEHWIHDCLHPAEVEYAMAEPSEYSQQTFLLGRLAMRQLLAEPYDAPILKDDHKRPAVPPIYLGSISHKRSIADGMTGVALLAPRVEGMGVGVDIELAFSNRRSIAKRVLTENEIKELGRIEVSVRLMRKRYCEHAMRVSYSVLLLMN